MFLHGEESFTGLLHTVFDQEGVTEFQNHPIQFVLLISGCFNGWNCVNHTDGRLHNGLKSVRAAFSHGRALPQRDSITAFTNCYLFRDCPHPPSDSRTFCETLWEHSNRLIGPCEVDFTGWSASLSEISHCRECTCTENGTEKQFYLIYLECNG